MSQLNKLLHFADSTLPVGSFAYSYGLERTISTGLIINSSDLKNHVYSFLQQAVSMEIPFINSSYDLQNPFSKSDLVQIVQSYNAMMLVPSVYKSSVTLGKTWFRLLEAFYPNIGLDKIRNYFIKMNLPFHYVIILTLGLKTVDFSLPDVRILFLHSVLRDQISSAIRLGIIGTMEGNLIQHEFYNFFDELIQSFNDTHYTEANRSSFLLELNQMNHKHIYSKLFQN